MEMVNIKETELGLVVSSRTVAEELGKRHDNVKRDLENILMSSNVSALIFKSEYTDSRGRTQEEYLLTKDGFTLYMFNIQGHNDFKMAYINRFNEMEQVIKENNIQLPSDPMEILELVFNANKKTTAEVKQIKYDVDYLKDNVKLDASEYGVIAKRVNDKVRHAIKNYNLANTKEVKGILYKDINGAIKSITNTPTRSQLKQKHFNEVLEFINDWEPSAVSLHKVRQLNIFEVK